MNQIAYIEAVKSVSEPIGEIKSSLSKDQFRSMMLAIEGAVGEKGVSGDDVNKMNPLRHNFGDGCYIREIFMPKDAIIVSKLHAKTHPFFILKGDVIIISEDGEASISAPYYGMTQAGTKRIIICLSDTILVTVHVTDSKDLDEIEEEIIAKDFDDLEVSV